MVAGFKKFGMETILGMDFRDFVDYRFKKGCYLAKSVHYTVGKLPWTTGMDARTILTDPEKFPSSFSSEAGELALRALSELEIGYYPIFKYQMGHLSQTGALSAYRQQLKGV